MLCSVLFDSAFEILKKVIPATTWFVVIPRVQINIEGRFCSYGSCKYKNLQLTSKYFINYANMEEDDNVTVPENILKVANVTTFICCRIQKEGT